MEDILRYALTGIEELDVPFDKETLVSIFTKRLSEIKRLPFKDGERLSVKFTRLERENRFISLSFIPEAIKGYQLTVYLVYPNPEEELNVNQLFLELFPGMLVTNAGRWMLTKNHIDRHDPSFTHLSYWDLFEKLLLRVERGAAPEHLVEMFASFRDLETTCGRFEIRPDDTDDGFVASYDNLVMLKSVKHPQLDQTYIGLRFDYLN